MEMLHDMYIVSSFLDSWTSENFKFKNLKFNFGLERNGPVFGLSHRNMEALLSGATRQWNRFTLPRFALWSGCQRVGCRGSFRRYVLVPPKLKLLFIPLQFRIGTITYLFPDDSCPITFCGGKKPPFYPPPDPLLSRRQYRWLIDSSVTLSTVSCFG